MWEPPNDPDYVERARARHGRVPAHADDGRRQAQAEPEPAGRGRRDDHRRAGGGARTPNPRLAARCAGPTTRGGGAVTAVGDDRRHVSRTSGWPARAGLHPFDDGPVDVHSPTASIADIAPAGALRAGGVLDGGRRLADPRALGPPRARRAVGARRSARSARRSDSAAARRAMMGGARSLPTDGASAPASATRCGAIADARVLDAATGDIPTYLINADVHSVWLNTAASGARATSPTASAPARRARVRDLATAQRRGSRDRRSAGRGWRGMRIPRRRRARRPRHGVERGAWARRTRAGSTRCGSSSASTRSTSTGRSPRGCGRAIRRAERHPTWRASAAQGDHRRVARHTHRRLLALLSG